MPYIDLDAFFEFVKDAGKVILDIYKAGYIKIGDNYYNFLTAILSVSIFFYVLSVISGGDDD